MGASKNQSKITSKKAGRLFLYSRFGDFEQDKHKWPTQVVGSTWSKSQNMGKWVIDQDLWVSEECLSRETHKPRVWSIVDIPVSSSPHTWELKISGIVLLFTYLTQLRKWHKRADNLMCKYGTLVTGEPPVHLAVYSWEWNKLTFYFKEVVLKISDGLIQDFSLKETATCNSCNVTGYTCTGILLGKVD